MRIAMTALAVAAVILTVPAQAETVIVEAEGWLEFSMARHWPWTEINVGDTVTVSFEVDSGNYLDGTNFPTRGYLIDEGSFAVTSGSVSWRVLMPLTVSPRYRYQT